MMSDLLLISGLSYEAMLGMRLGELSAWHSRIVQRYNELHGTTP